MHKKKDSPSHGHMQWCFSLVVGGVHIRMMGEKCLDRLRLARPSGGRQWRGIEGPSGRINVCPVLFGGRQHALATVALRAIYPPDCPRTGGIKALTYIIVNVGLKRPPAASGT